MEKLPSDIMLDILSRLPHETMINCKLVCKHWRDITTHIKVGFIFQFGKSGFKLCHGGGDDDNTMQGHYSFKTLLEIDNHPSFEPEDIVGSCNGLVCLSVENKSSRANYTIYICNPITEEYVYLPTFNYNKACNSKTDGYFHCGFVYHHSTDEYKVVRIYYEHDNHNGRVKGQGQVQVYTLGSGHGWRDIGRTNHHLDYIPGVCANGALHWIEHRKHRIVAFDLLDEAFRLIPSPPLSPNRGFTAVFVELFGGYLCVVHLDVGKKDKFIHVWALDKKKKFRSSYDVKGHEFNDLWRWSKKFSIPSPMHAVHIPFAVTKRNQLLLTSDEAVYCYDLGTKVLRKLWDDCRTSYNLAIPHVNSLVSLEALGEKSKSGRR